MLLVDVRVALRPTSLVSPRGPGARRPPGETPEKQVLGKFGAKMMHITIHPLRHLRSDDMTHETTRRTVLLATGATSVAALVAACGGGGDDSGSESTSSPTGEGATSGPGGGVLANIDEIPVGGGKIFKDEKVVVTQPEQGRFKAFSAICTHQHCLVGSVSDGTINCPCHGSKFKIADGAVTHGPATRPLPAEQITVEGNSIRMT
ncbi:hypothetical protein GCM10010104_65370 [Streptomyces indiaensis]|uniref:Cytochrome bc1 complex Rieske iron-sulfur subunit n=2 Tax=Streptomyces TaxID=1883 RepID=A0ABP5RE70_9ACTN